MEKDEKDKILVYVINILYTLIVKTPWIHYKKVLLLILFFTNLKQAVPP